MNLLARYLQRGQELRQVNAQIASYQTALRELFVRRARLHGQLAELDDIIIEAQAEDQRAAQLAAQQQPPAE